jgi:hypothetical protein
MKVQQNRAIVLGEKHKLDQKLLDKDLKPIQTNLRWHLHGIILKEI